MEGMRRWLDGVLMELCYEMNIFVLKLRNSWQRAMNGLLHEVDVVIDGWI
jgi:hypothetical protein